MKKINYILLIICIFTICITHTNFASAKYNNIYLNKEKIFPKLLSTFSGDYISINELISKILIDFKRIDQYTISSEYANISFIPSAIFLKCTYSNSAKVIQLYKPLVKINNSNDETYIAIVDLKNILNEFSILSAKVLNNDLIIEKINNIKLNSKVKPDPNVITIINEKIKNNQIKKNENKTTMLKKDNSNQKPENPSIDTNKIIPNSYQIPENLIRRNIKE